MKLLIIMILLFVFTGGLFVLLFEILRYNDVSVTDGIIDEYPTIDFDFREKGEILIHKDAFKNLSDMKKLQNAAQKMAGLGVKSTDINLCKNEEGLCEPVDYFAMVEQCKKCKKLG